MTFKNWDSSKGIRRKITSIARHCFSLFSLLNIAFGFSPQSLFSRHFLFIQELGTTVTLCQILSEVGE